MKLYGLIGIIVLPALAWLFSKNRRIVKPRILIWGIALQFLFAAILLSESPLSWVGMLILSYLILLYVFSPQILVNQTWLQTITKGILLLSAALLASAVFYYMDKAETAVFFITFFSVGIIAFRLLKKGAWSRYLFAATLPAVLGMLVQRGIYGKQVFAWFSDLVTKFLKFADQGSMFLFGNLADSAYFDQYGFQFAFTVLPIIIYFSAIISLLYYYGIMQALVKIMAKFMKWTMGTSGAETLSCSANIFVGQTESPLLIKPFLHDMTESEIHAVMVGGFATIAGSVLGGYIGLGVNAGHLITASVMSAPAALVMAKLLLPETEQSKTAGDVTIPQLKRADNLLDALTQGITDGLKLAVNVGAMLIAFIALIALLNAFFGFFDRIIDGRLLGGAINEISGEYSGFFPGSLKTLFGTLFAPLAFAMGVPWNEAATVGNLMGIKISLNEMLGYVELVKHINAGDLSNRSVIIATYALCGFANFASIGIQIGGISALAPNRRPDIARVAFRAMCGGALASWLTATIAGLII